MEDRESGTPVNYLLSRALRERLDGPALQWLTVDEPACPVSVGAADRVIDCHFDPEFDAWEALVVVEPREAREE